MAGRQSRRLVGDLGRHCRGACWWWGSRKVNQRCRDLRGGAKRRFGRSSSKISEGEDADARFGMRNNGGRAVAGRFYLERQTLEFLGDTGCRDMKYGIMMDASSGGKDSRLWSRLSGGRGSLYIDTKAWAGARGPSGNSWRCWASGFG